MKFFCQRNVWAGQGWLTFFTIWIKSFARKQKRLSFLCKKYIKYFIYKYINAR
ncbi:hypothetical protein DWUX_229 [Desulfovibrio diazotrophicus]|nr:hypothetical protein DWUX_229 [Desulfovibrio diazotrophicus]